MINGRLDESTCIVFALNTEVIKNLVENFSMRSTIVCGAHRLEKKKTSFNWINVCTIDDDQQQTMILGKTQPYLQDQKQSIIEL
mgnify:CR=1 FL=1